MSVWEAGKALIPAQLRMAFGGPPCLSCGIMWSVGKRSRTPPSLHPLSFSRLEKVGSSKGKEEVRRPALEFWLKKDNVNVGQLIGNGHDDMIQARKDFW